VFADLFFASTHLLAYPVGPLINKIDMATFDLDTDNVIAVTEADLREE